MNKLELKCPDCDKVFDTRVKYSGHTRHGCITGKGTWHQRNKDYTKEYNKKYREKNKDELKEYHKKYLPTWRSRNKEKVKEQRKRTRDILRKDVLDAYGHMCQCCFEDRHEFLAIDHINGGGNKHRRELHPNASAQTFYTWLRKNEYPSGFQILCHNCNSAKSYYGKCPHQKN